jgi:hypothetical protein
MKRITTLAAAVLMAATLGACGQKEPKAPEVSTPDAAVEQTQDQSASAADTTGAEDVAPAASDEATTSTDQADTNAQPDAAAEGTDSTNTDTSTGDSASE